MAGVATAEPSVSLLRCTDGPITLLNIVNPLPIVEGLNLPFCHKCSLSASRVWNLGRGIRENPKATRLQRSLRPRGQRSFSKL